jgi:TPR repeat protein
MQNDPRAQRRLALCYFRGLGIKQNEKEAIKWLEISAKNGDREALKLLSP